MENTETRTITVPHYIKVTEEVIERLDGILNFASPEDYRETLIEIYHDYINLQAPDFPSNFKEMAGQMYFLIDFFRRVSEEMKGEGKVAD